MNLARLLVLLLEKHLFQLSILLRESGILLQDFVHFQGADLQLLIRDSDVLEFVLERVPFQLQSISLFLQRGDLVFLRPQLAFQLCDGLFLFEYDFGLNAVVRLTSFVNKQAFETQRTLQRHFVFDGLHVLELQMDFLGQPGRTLLFPEQEPLFLHFGELLGMFARLKVEDFFFEEFQTFHDLVWKIGRIQFEFHIEELADFHDLAHDTFFHLFLRLSFLLDLSHQVVLHHQKLSENGRIFV